MASSYRQQQRNLLRSHVQCPISLTDFNQIWTFIKVLNIKFRESPSSGSRSDTCRQTDGRADRRQTWRNSYSLFATWLESA